MSVLAQTPDALTEFVQRFGVAVGMFLVSTVGSFVLGRWIGNRRARRQFETKQFLGRINISLNVLRDGKLKIRTLMERSLEEIFPNRHAVDKVLAMAQKATLADPLLPIPEADRWFLLNFVLNAVAEHFNVGVVKYDAGEPIKAVTYGLCLTCEVVGEDRIRKVRAMLLRKECLTDFPYPDTLPELENPWHDVRVDTLRKMAKAYRENPERFLMLEIYG